MAERGHSDSVLIGIGLLKVLEGALLVLVALGAHHLLHKDIQQTVVHWARVVRVDPGNRFAHAALTRLTGMSPKKLEEISLGTLLYAALFMTEGVGLLLRKRWAEYVAVISTAGFLPIEVYEMFHRFHWTKVAVLVINILIVVYLIVRLVQTRRSTQERTTPPQNEAESLAGGT